MWTCLWEKRKTKAVFRSESNRCVDRLESAQADIRNVTLDNTSEYQEEEENWENFVDLGYLIKKKEIWLRWKAEQAKKKG